MTRVIYRDNLKSKTPHGEVIYGSTVFRLTMDAEMNDDGRFFSRGEAANGTSCTVFWNVKASIIELQRKASEAEAEARRVFETGGEYHEPHGFDLLEDGSEYCDWAAPDAVLVP
jgi:hypothetical protein